MHFLGLLLKTIRFKLSKKYGCTENYGIQVFEDVFFKMQITNSAKKKSNYFSNFQFFEEKYF